MKNISAEIIKQIEDKILDTYLLSEKQFNSVFKLCDFSIEDLGERVRGIAFYPRNLIKININYLSYGGEHLVDVIKTTVPHEIAHLITYQLFPNAKQSHGPEWRTVMVKLGLPPVTRHSMFLPNKNKFVYTCGCREYQVSKLIHNKMQRGSERFCRICKKDVYFVRNGG